LESSWFKGREKEKVAPESGLFLAKIFPPGDPNILRIMDQKGIIGQ
jgi:hypothetical protein